MYMAFFTHSILFMLQIPEGLLVAIMLVYGAVDYISMETGTSQTLISIHGQTGGNSQPRAFQ